MSGPGEAYEDRHFDYLDSMEALGAFDALADEEGAAYPHSEPYSWADLNQLFEQW